MLKRVFPLFMITLLVIAGCEKDKYNFESLPDTVKSYFTYGTNTVLNIDETVQFANESENGVSFHWDFGDGTTSSEKNPTKTYPSPGSYTVKLTVIGAGGTGNYSTNITVVDPNAVVDTDMELYFIEYNNPPRAIRKISLVPGSPVETIISLVGKVGVGMVFDDVNEKILYADFQSGNSGKIWLIDADGGSAQELVSGLVDPYDVALNHDAGKIYIADDANVSRTNTDGSGYEKEFINIIGGDIRAVAYSKTINKIYFIDYEEEDLYVANADGTAVNKLIANVFGNSLFVDDVNGVIYFEDRAGGARVIRRANLDGSGLVKFVDTPGTQVFGLAVDHEAGKFYWSERDNGTVKRANLDGTEIETFLSGLNSPRGIFIK